MRGYVRLDAGEWCALPPGLGQDSQMPERFEGKWTGVSAVCPIGNDVSLERKLQTLQQPRVFPGEVGASAELSFYRVQGKVSGAVFVL